MYVLRAVSVKIEYDLILDSPQLKEKQNLTFNLSQLKLVTVL